MPPAKRSDDTDDKTTTVKSTRAKDEERQEPETPQMAGADQESEGAYSKAAGDLAAAAREAAEEIRERMADLRERFDKVQETAPSASEGMVADGVRRVPMAAGEVERVAEGLLAAAGDLAQRAAR